VLALVDRWANIFFKSMPMLRNPVAYLLRVAAAPNGLDFGKVRVSTIVCVLRTIRIDDGHTQRAKSVQMQSQSPVMLLKFKYWLVLRRVLQ
jgi:hypothetical protein